MATTIQGYYKGLHLPSYIQYDPNNIKKANSVLAIAFKEQHQLYEFELPINTDFNQFGSYNLYLKDLSAKFLWRLIDNRHYNLCIYTHLNIDAALKCVNKLNPDYTFNKHIADIEANAVEAALTTYTLAEYDPSPKKSKKAKRLAGSDLSDEEKQQSVEFAIAPKIIRPS